MYIMDMSLRTLELSLIREAGVRKGNGRKVFPINQVGLLK